MYVWTASAEGHAHSLKLLHKINVPHFHYIFSFVWGVHWLYRILSQLSALMFFPSCEWVNCSSDRLQLLNSFLDDKWIKIQYSVEPYTLRYSCQVWLKTTHLSLFSMLGINEHFSQIGTIKTYSCSIIRYAGLALLVCNNIYTESYKRFLLVILQCSNVAQLVPNIALLVDSSLAWYSLIFVCCCDCSWR